jgi:hypothetical protein
MLVIFCFICFVWSPQIPKNIDISFVLQNINRKPLLRCNTPLLSISQYLWFSEARESRKSTMNALKLVGHPVVTIIQIDVFYLVGFTSSPRVTSFPVSYSVISYTIGVSDLCVFMPC